VVTLEEAYSDILAKYLKIAKRYSGKDKKILKTDCFNEVNSFPVPGGIAKNIKGNVKMLELRSQLAGRARLMGFDVTQGDIRNIPFKDNFFDIIFDFSTIDHVENYEEVIFEYYRVLKTGGFVNIVYWTKPKKQVLENQIYFEKKEFLNTVNKYFEMKDETLIFSDSKRELWFYRGHIEGKWD
jgi:SAM-dependent methyltransferase